MTSYDDAEAVRASGAAPNRCPLRALPRVSLPSPRPRHSLRGDHGSRRSQVEGANVAHGLNHGMNFIAVGMLIARSVQLSGSLVPPLPPAKCRS